MENLEESLKDGLKKDGLHKMAVNAAIIKVSGRVKCRPSKKVSKKTPKTWSELGKKEKAKAVRNKQAAHRRGHQFSSHRSTKTWSASKGKYQPSEKKESILHSVSKFILEKWNQKIKKHMLHVRQVLKVDLKFGHLHTHQSAVVRCYKKKVGSGD
jgi:hypothetical protein